MKKIISKIVALGLVLALIFLSIASALAASVGFDLRRQKTPISSETQFFFRLLNPWDETGAHGEITAEVKRALQDYTGWYARRYAIMPEHFQIYLNRLLGNTCENIKINSLNFRAKEYLLWRRKIVLAWPQQGSVAATKILYLREFIAQEIAKSQTSSLDENGFVLVTGTKSQARAALCGGDSPENLTVPSCDPADTGEYCAQLRRCDIEDSEAAEVVCEPVSNPALEKVQISLIRAYQRLWCFQNISDEATNRQAENAVLDYIDRTLEFYTKIIAGISVPEYQLTYNYQKGEAEDLQKQRQEQCLDETQGSSALEYCQQRFPEHLSCLDTSEYPRFINANYQGTCACPAWEPTFKTVLNIFQELLEKLENLPKIISTIRDLMDFIFGDTTFKDLYGDAWEKFTEEARKEARAEFTEMFGYPPREDAGQEGIMASLRHLFKHQIGQGEAFGFKVTLEGEVIRPQPTMADRLRKAGQLSISDLQYLDLLGQEATTRTVTRTRSEVDVMHLIAESRQIVKNAEAFTKAARRLSGMICPELKSSATYEKIRSNLDKSLQAAKKSGSKEWQKNAQAGIRGVEMGDKMDKFARMIFGDEDQAGSPLCAALQLLEDKTGK